MKFELRSSNPGPELKEYADLLREHHFDIQSGYVIDVRTLDDIKRIQEITKAKWGVVLDFDDERPILTLYDDWLE